MSTLYSIIVENKSTTAQNFFFFQQPAEYSGGAKVFTNSIGYKALPASKPGRTTQAQFTLLQQYYAGVQDQMTPPAIGVAQVGVISQAEIDLAPAAGGIPTADGTNVVIEPSLYLTAAVHKPSVQSGAFRITTPQFNPHLHKMNVGLSTTNSNGKIVLSNFINGEPNKNIDVQPIVKFYVSTGSYQAGTTVNFTTSSVNSALCDATDGVLSFKVTYNADGTWTVIPQANVVATLKAREERIVTSITVSPGQQIQIPPNIPYIEVGNESDDNEGAMVLHSERNKIERYLRPLQAIQVGIPFPSEPSVFVNVGDTKLTVTL